MQLNSVQHLLTFVLISLKASYKISTGKERMKEANKHITQTKDKTKQLLAFREQRNCRRYNRTSQYVRST
jgi:hypothetical protein